MESSYKCLLFFAAITGALSAEFYSCGWIASANVDCTRFPEATNCGTDTVTYTNKCYFSKAHCINTDLHMLHPGACNSIDFQVTPIPANGGDLVFDFFCTSLSHMDCGTASSPICATDGRTYTNECEYEKAKCTHRDLKITNFGACTN